MNPQVEDLVQDPVNKKNLDYDIDDKEVKEIMEVTAGTGKFWHHWNLLKSLLSYRLKQVLAEYPESQDTATESQKSPLSDETYPELVQRLDEALLNFTEGPPFTLQRLCEILLDPKGTYPRLSKLALALEKNLLVTSTLCMCTTDPYPGSITNSLPEPAKVDGVTQEKTDTIQNGESNAGGDADVEMVDMEANDDNKNKDVDMQEDNIAEVSGNIAEPTNSNSSESENEGASN